MNVTIRREISMAHRLLGYDGLCAFIHGHNYIFEITVTGKPNPLGLVIDFKALRKTLDEILEPFDHSLVLHHEDPVAEVLRMERLVLLSVNPTAENLASLVYGKLVDRNLPPARVIVRETENGWAEATAVAREVRIKAVQ